MAAYAYNDGGRAAAGFTGKTGDCVTRSIAIATGKPYQEVYDALNELAKSERPRRGWKSGKRTSRSTSRNGVHRRTYERFLTALGWRWTPTMQVGSGCKVHLRADELPSGRLVVAVSRHMVAVIDGVVHDTHDPSRDGTRCVYGYYQPPIEQAAHEPTNPAETIQQLVSERATLESSLCDAVREDGANGLARFVRVCASIQMMTAEIRRLNGSAVDA